MNYDKAWKEIVGDYTAFLNEIAQIVPVQDEQGKPRCIYDIFRDLANVIYGAKEEQK